MHALPRKAADQAPRRPIFRLRVVVLAGVIATGILAGYSLVVPGNRIRDSGLTDFARTVPELTSPVSAVSEPLNHEDFKPAVVIPRAFPAISDVPIVSADRATLEDDELVLGVRVNGKSRAYAINMLTGPQREIINDQLGGTAIATTW